jgi:Cdc6-like AAA superfamily ATPase
MIIVTILNNKYMKIIMLIGPRNCGKTTTIRKTYDELSNNHHAKVIQLKPYPTLQDFDAVLELPNGKKIGFHSEGDLARSLIAAMNDYNDSGICDILVCACTEIRVTPPDMAEDIVGTENLIFVFKERVPATEQCAANEKCRDIIIDHINKLILQ